MSPRIFPRQSNTSRIAGSGRLGSFAPADGNNESIFVDAEVAANDITNSGSDVYFTTVLSNTLRLFDRVDPTSGNWERLPFHSL